MKCKYKPGDWLKLKGSDVYKMQVVETLVQSCPAGSQFHYTCRMFSKELGSKWLAGREYLKYNEVEVEKYPLKEEAAKELIEKQRIEKQRNGWKHYDVPGTSGVRKTRRKRGRK